MKFKTQCPQIKSDWNIAMLIHVRIACGYCSTTRTELRVVTETILPTKPKTATIWPFTKKGGQSLNQSAAIKSIYQPRFTESMYALK